MKKINSSGNKRIKLKSTKWNITFPAFMMMVDSLYQLSGRHPPRNSLGGSQGGFWSRSCTSTDTWTTCGALTHQHAVLHIRWTLAFSVAQPVTRLFQAVSGCERVCGDSKHLCEETSLVQLDTTVWAELRYPGADLGKVLLEKTR